MLRCKECKGTNIQVLAWVDVNTYEYKEDWSDGDINDNWCEDCNKNVKFEEIEEEEQ